MAPQPQPRFAFEDYLITEREAEVRHEYVDGQVFDMVGATAEHNIIVANITAAFVNQLKERPSTREGCTRRPINVRRYKQRMGSHPWRDISELTNPRPGLRRFASCSA